MEKRGIIEQGRTPPEGEDKQASEDALEEHVSKRAAEAVQGELEQADEKPAMRVM